MDLYYQAASAFVDVAVNRWERSTGKSAVLDGTSRTFAEIVDERRKQQVV